MGLFDFLFNGGKKTGKHVSAESEPHSVPAVPLTSMGELVTVAPGITLPEIMARHWNEIRQTERTFVTIKATPAQDLTVRQSKFGGYPCLPVGFQYPKDQDGQYLFPLAQINFSECPSLEGFPTSGYLQFYIGIDDLYGMDFDDQQKQAGFRVLFFEEAEVTEPMQDFSFLQDLLKEPYSPVPGPYRLEFERKTEYIGQGDYQGENHPAYNLEKMTKKYPGMEDALWEAHFEAFSAAGHKLGGYAYFTQEDPRKDRPEWQEYILLFQLDSDNDIMWGDVGVGNFFIHPNDLANKDFSNVIYNWDCH